MKKEAFQLFSQYNRWMNEKLFQASAKLSADELTQNKGAFFGSILGTLNHLMVADIIWLQRFTLGQHKFESLANIAAMATPSSLDALLFHDLESLRVARQKLDADLVSFCTEVSTEQLAQKLNYKNFKGDSYSDELGLLLQHLFNHQTHHRGQITTLLSQAGIDVGPTDLLVCIREL
ncbi:MAG: DinB family protein [Pseudohongiellaceae bacterium]